MDTDEPAASALVILRTDATCDDATRADPASARRVQDHLRSLGFDVGPLVGTSFSITAPVDLFRRSFGDDRPFAADEPRPAGDAPLDLPVDRLPDEAARAVRSITFSPPPDFGPLAP
jgi:hypothetical protein